jgi:hypothetical protein
VNSGAPEGLAAITVCFFPTLNKVYCITVYFPFGILDLHLLIIPMASSIYIFWLSLWYLRFTSSDYPFGILDLHLLIIPLVSSIYISLRAFSVMRFELNAHGRKGWWYQREVIRRCRSIRIKPRTKRKSLTNFIA